MEEQGISQGGLEAKPFAFAARGKAFQSVDQRKEHFAAEVENFAGTIDDVARNLREKGHEGQAGYAERVAGWGRQASRMLRERTSEELWGRARHELSERPAIVAVSAFALAFLGVRLLKS